MLKSSERGDEVGVTFELLFSMRLWIVRHAKAEPAETWQGHDDDRPLTAAGDAAFRELVMDLAREGEFEKLSEIWHSPLVRARQTAAIVGAVTGKRVSCVSALRPPIVFEALKDLMPAVSVRNVLLVSHQPDVSNLVHALASAAAVAHPRRALTAQFPHQRYAVGCVFALRGRFARGGCRVLWDRRPAKGEEEVRAKL